MNNSQLKVRPGFAAFFVGFLCLAIIIALLAQIYIGGKPTAIDIAMRGCKDYLKYVTHVTTNKVFIFKREVFLDFEKVEISREIFHPNRNLWIKTNFIVNLSKPELAIVCRQQFYYPRMKNSLGWSYGRLKPAYVVGFSDGKAELISQEQFSSLTTDGFIPLFAPASEKGGKP
jgi:hypothetical protein